MFKLIKYQIVDGELVLELAPKEGFDQEFAGDFLKGSVGRVGAEIRKFIRDSNINFAGGPVKVLMGGAVLTTLFLTPGVVRPAQGEEVSQDYLIQWPEALDQEQSGPVEGELPAEEALLSDAVDEEVAGPVRELRQMNLVLIAGHSTRSDDPGAVYNGRYECDYTAELVTLVRKELNQRKDININIITEKSPVALTGEIDFLKATKADYALSIHFNAGGGSGSEIIVPYSAADLTVAEQILNNFQQFNQPLRQTALYSRSNSEKTARKNGVAVKHQKDYYGIIRTGTEKGIHSDILEVEFIDNEKNMTFYDNHKSKYVTAVVDALVHYYQNNFINQ